MGGLLVAALARPALRRIWRASLTRLKTLVEATPRPLVAACGESAFPETTILAGCARPGNAQPAESGQYWSR